ncbi:MAG: histidine phosphatase family protein [Flavobacteriia bacterium]|nr:histidine phosphatase family protein [Flavobacteriia bacterium]
MKLHLLRHAKTETSSINLRDFDRSLVKKGELQSELMANYLKTTTINQSIVCCSDARRAQQTLTIIAHKIKFSNLQNCTELYLPDSLSILKFISKITTTNDVFIISHNNGLSDFASYISDEFIDLKTCEYICLEFNFTSWKEITKSSGKIISRYRPVVES